MEIALLLITSLNLFSLAALLVLEILHARMSDRTEKEIKKLEFAVTRYVDIQKRNTEKLIELLQRPFEPQLTKSPNNIVQKDENIFELDENVPVVIPPDVKIEVEGGDTQIPPGYKS